MSYLGCLGLGHPEHFWGSKGSSRKLGVLGQDGLGAPGELKEKEGMERAVSLLSGGYQQRPEAPSYLTGTLSSFP